MKLDLDRPAAEMSPGARIRYAARAAFLLLGAAAASAFMVELPAPQTSGQAGTPTYVPASDKWRPLGEPATPDAHGPKALGAFNPPATMGGGELRSRRSQRGIRLQVSGVRARGRGPLRLDP